MKFLVCAFLAAAVPSMADTVLFSDLGTGGSVYTAGPGSVMQGQSGDNIAQARPFTVAGSGSFSLTQFDLGVVKDPKRFGWVSLEYLHGQHLDRQLQQSWNGIGLVESVRH